MKKTLFALLLFVSIHASGQLNNRAFEQRMQVIEADSGKLFLGINFLGFGKDNEYSNTTVDGYTLFGYQLNPYLSYQLAKNVRLDAGLYLQKDFGNDDYTEIAPTFSLKIKKDNVSFIFGTLEGSLSHRLIEPLYDFERVINNRLENGIQVIWNKDDLFFDTWIDWQKMIYMNSDFPEMFTAGMSINKTVAHFGDVLIDLPLQIVVTHQGGQIDTVDSEVITDFNAAGGITVERTSSSFVSRLGISAYITGYGTNANNPPFQDGAGVFINPYLKFRIGLTLMGSYWRGEQYLTLQGSQIYPSVPNNYPDRVDEIREFFMLRVLYDLKLADGLMLTARAEPFYDTYSSTFQSSFGLYLSFSDRFFLLNAKQGK